MPQIIESQFRVLEVNQWDVYISDFEGSGLPVHVELEDDSYDSAIEETISELEAGNKIEAEIRSESVAMSDDLWFFLSLDILERTRFHFIDDAGTHPRIVNRLMDNLSSVDGNSIRKFVTTDGRRTGYITVAEAQSGDLWTGLRAGTRSHETDLEFLTNIGNPPHEIVYTRTPDNEHLVFYHFSDLGTELAESIIEANQ